MASDEPLVDVRSLSVTYTTYRGKVRAITNLNLRIPKGRIVAVVGESGCGKSTLGLSLIRLLPRSATTEGKILYSGRNVLEMSEEEFTMVRGTGISMIFQEPMSSLDPVYTVGRQLMEAIDVREGRKNPAERRRGPFQRSRTERVGVAARMFGTYSLRRPTLYNQEIVDALARVQISDPERVVDKYPHELSGGMAQRVMIAQALLERPSVLIADEPTSALDVTSQAQVLNLMRGLKEELGSSIVFITHDLAVAAQVADEVVVMYAGEIVEHAETGELFEHPLHPYTEGLLNSFPRYYRDEGRVQEAIKGDVPNLLSPPMGCRFSPRCKYSMKVCTIRAPTLAELGPSHSVACFLRSE